MLAETDLLVKEFMLLHDLLRLPLAHRILELHTAKKPIPSADSQRDNEYDVDRSAKNSAHDCAFKKCFHFFFAVPHSRDDERVPALLGGRFAPRANLRQLRVRRRKVAMPATKIAKMTCFVTYPRG